VELLEVARRRLRRLPRAISMAKEVMTMALCDCFAWWRGRSPASESDRSHQVKDMRRLLMT